MPNLAIPLDSPVTVVIPTYNRGEEVVRALQALRAQTVRPHAVIVVDNSSTDDTAERVAAQRAEWGPGLRYIRKAPEGPAAARNLGLRTADTSYVLFQDSDVELDADWLRRALLHIEASPRIAAVGGRIVYAFDPGRVNAYGGDLGWFGLAWDIDEGAELRADARAADRIWINCSAMLARREAALASGGFDDAFFYGYEDTDLGWRLRIAGYSVRVAPELIALHHVQPQAGAAHPEIVYHYCKNRLHMLVRNTQARRLPLVLGTYLLYTAADLLLRAPRRPKLRALAWNARRWRALLALRAATQRTRRVPDAAIFAAGSGRALPPTRLDGQRRRGLPEACRSAAAPGRVDDRV